MDPMQPYDNWNPGQTPPPVPQQPQPQFIPPQSHAYNAPQAPPPPPPVYNAGGINGAGGGQNEKAGKNPFGFALCGISLALVILTLSVLVFSIGSVSALRGLVAPSKVRVNPPGNSFSVISVVGAIQSYGSDSLGVYEPSYRHNDTVSYIKSLAQNPNDKGILLYLNTPGGGVFESDEVYLALMDYKEQTGRPVWAYMSQTCASGGYYICAAADYIVANRNTTTGSIGVYIAMVDTSGLYDKLGLETVLIKSGANKGTGISGTKITKAQQAVYQSIVDESYQQFVEIIAEGRGMTESDVIDLADGRVYSGRQALQNGLVDELGDWESCYNGFVEETGARAFYPSFSRSTPLGEMLGGLVGEMPVGDIEASIREAEKITSGVPMAMYTAEVWP